LIHGPKVIPNKTTVTCKNPQFLLSFIIGLQSDV
jgi:hypothetical protein